MKTGEASERLKAEHGIDVETQTVTGWVRDGKVPGRKFMGRWYVDWDALLALVREQAEDDSGAP